MSTTSSRFGPPAWLKPHLTVYNITVASVLGGASVGFGALIFVLLLISANFNVLGWME